ncbi:MAG: YcgL domain-containing protein [Thioalkalispiraceae bacterium]|jgi:uncharacterized protein YcgL (UPF0745 family)
MSSIVTPCAIYKGSKKQHTYLYVCEKDKFDEVPELLLNSLGNLEFVMELDLFPDKKLAQANAKEVIEKLNDQGFYLQLPPADYKPEI